MSVVDGVNDQAFKAWSAPSVSKIYEKTRPNYNLDSVEFLLEKVGALRSHSQPFTIVEVGAGTGKFTRAALKVLERRSVKNVKIISTEPIKEMCETFKETVPGIEIRQCPAKNLGLPSASAHAVLAAQCFHWFGTDAKAISEIHRVLKPEGILGIIWNIPDRSVSWIKAIEDMLDPSYEKIQIPRADDEVVLFHVKQHDGFGEEMAKAGYGGQMKLDFDGVINRYRSYSVISGAEEHEREVLLSKITNILKTSPDVVDHKEIIYKYVTMIHWFRKNKL